MVKWRIVTMPHTQKGVTMAWFKDWTPAILAAAKRLQKQIAAEGHIPLTEEISRYEELVPEAPTRRYWDKARHDLGRMLRQEVLPVRNKRKRNGVKVNLTHGFTTSETITMIEHQDLVNGDMIGSLLKSVHKAVAEQNKKRRSNGHGEIDPTTTKVCDVISHKDLVKAAADFCARAVTDRRRARENA